MSLLHDAEGAAEAAIAVAVPETRLIKPALYLIGGLLLTGLIGFLAWWFVIRPRAAQVHAATARVEAATATAAAGAAQDAVRIVTVHDRSVERITPSPKEASMPFNPPPMRACRCLRLLPLCAALSACTTPIALTQSALPCAALVRSSALLQPTPAAPLPSDDTAGALGLFAVRQTSQLARANADKTGVAAILDTCEQWQMKAAAAAKPRPWKRLWG